MAERYYYHSGNEILKYNADYQSLLKTLSILEAQKMKTIKDLELLTELNSKAETDPNSILTQLRDGSLVLPTRQVLASIPEIQWEQYRTLNESEGYNTRKKKMTPSDADAAMSIKEAKTFSDITVSRATKIKASNTLSVGGRNKLKGQAWSEEEQARLEELLKMYPPEEVEAKRWQKIASALGNRTPKQVCCRVQKYFIKLAKAGLPVPGRMPNLTTYARKGKIKRVSAKRQSLFFNSLKPKVYMEEEEKEERSIANTSEEEEEEEGEGEDHYSPCPSEDRPLSCSGCALTLLSMYWECQDCQVILCQSCINNQWSSSSHSSSHKLRQRVIDEEKESYRYIDQDYTGFNPSLSNAGYNYLDSNFRPAL